MKIGKRLLSALLCLAMMLSMLPTLVFAEVDAGADALPMGDANSITGANPTTDVKLTIDANAIVVDSTVTSDVTNYVLKWNGIDYADMFVYGTNLFATLNEAQEFILPGSTVLVKSLPESMISTTYAFTVAANYYTENYNTLPYVVGTAFDGSDWKENPEYTEKAVTLGNIKFTLNDADPEDDVVSAGTIGLYGFSFKLTGTSAISFNEMPDVFANFVIQNSAVNVSGGSPTIASNTYAGGEKANAKGASMLFKNFYLTGSATRLFTEYYVDYFTLDGWFVPDEFADTSYLMYLKTGALSGKSKLEITNSNFQGWKAHIYFEMNSGKNWFSAKNDTAISGATSDIEFRPVYITNNIFNNSSLWDKSAFHQTHANGTSKTVFTGNRIINKEAIVPFLVNNSAKYGNYFSLVMYNNYVEGYTSNPNLAESLAAGSSSAKTVVDIRNNYFSDNTESKMGTDYWIGCTGNPAADKHATDWYLDADMTLLKSAVAPLRIKSVSANNGDAEVINLDTNHMITYNLKEGNASALSFEFVTDGASAAWYSDIACTKPLDISTIKAGTQITVYLKVSVPEKNSTLTYSVSIFKAENLFSNVFTSEYDLLTKDMLVVSNMNSNAVAGYKSGALVEYKLPTDGKTYQFVKDVNIFEKMSDALAFAKAKEIVTPTVYFDYSNEGESISINQSVRVVAPNFDVKPFDDKGFSESTELSDGTGASAWSYNQEYDKNKRTVADFKFSGNVSPVVEIYGVELKSYLKSGTTYDGTNFDLTARFASDAACQMVFKNILITNALTRMFRFGSTACVENDSVLINNLYIRSAQAGGQLSFCSEYLPETTVIDGMFVDYNALGTDNRNQTRWYLKQGNSENTLTIKNSNLRNLYNENDYFISFMGNGESPAEAAGSCKITFEHNILYNFGTGVNKSGEAFFAFSPYQEDYSVLTLKNNFISAPAGKSFDLFNAGNDTGTSIKLDITKNIIKGLNGLGVDRPVNNASNIQQNYTTDISDADNSRPGQAIIFNWEKGSAVSKNHYLDYEMTLLNTAVEISNVKFEKGVLEFNSLKHRYTGIVNEQTHATVADFTFDVPEAGEYVWYEDSELTKPIKNEDLSKVDMYYTPVYLKVFAKSNPDQYIAYAFNLKTERTPTNLFVDTFVDPAGVIDRDKAFIVSSIFEKYSDGAYVETSFADDTLYSFVKGENAFNDYDDVLDYAEENGIESPHILVLDHTGMGKPSNVGAQLVMNTPAVFFTKNYNTNPVIQGNAVDGSDWGINIGTGEGQFNEDDAFLISRLQISSMAKPGEYGFYGFAFSGQIAENTVRKVDIDFKIVNAYFMRSTWTNSLVTFGKEQTAANTLHDSFEIKNAYFEIKSGATSSKLFEGTLPATFIFDTIYFNVERMAANGPSAYEINCMSDYRSFQIRNSCFKNHFFKTNSKMIKHAQTGKDVTAKEYAEYIIDGCTFVNSSFSGKSIFTADLDGLNLVQITNNKVYNESLNYDVLSSINSRDSAAIKMKLVITGNYFNKIKTAVPTLTRTLTDDSLVQDNYAVLTKAVAVDKVTYGGVSTGIKDGKNKTFTGDYYVDSELKCHPTDAIPATFSGEKIQKTETGAKYLITENDPVITDNGDGTCTINLSSIVTNPAGNRVEVQIGDTVKSLSDMPMTVAVDDPSEVTIKVIGYALVGEDSVENTLVLSEKVAQIDSIMVGDVVAQKSGDAFAAVLPSAGADEAITATALANGTTITIIDENGAPATNVNLLAGESATFTITATIGSDTKTYVLTVSRESGDKTALIAELEQLIETANNELDANGKTWLAGVKEVLIDKISEGYAAIDEKKNADALTLAVAELQAALDDARDSAEYLTAYKEVIELYKAIDNADGEFCAPTFTQFTNAIAKAERDIQTAATNDAVIDIIFALADAADSLATHSFTNYVHNAGSENCASNGTMTAKCDTNACPVTDTVEETGNYKNDKHNFTNYVYNNDATFEQDGTETAKCSRCPETHTRVAEGTQLEFVDSADKFKDVTAKDWYKDYVDYTVTFGIMSGKAADKFAPVDTITRAEFVQVLANLSGVDTANKNVTTKFADVKSGAWYAPAVKWASENGIVSGKGTNTFDPNANITREEMCVMLVNYAAFENIELEKAEEKANFADDAKISSWAKERVYMCQMADIVNGKGGNKFDPQATALRAEAATIFSIFHISYMA